MDKKYLQDTPTCPEGITPAVTNTEASLDNSINLLATNYCPISE